jgi:phosphopantothenoylcysteine decarboxylase
MPSWSDDRSRVLHLVVCAAPPARRIPELVKLLHAERWDVHIVVTPSALAWIDRDEFAAVTGHRVRAEPRRPDEPKTVPSADAVAVVPATFNTINKWAAGINDTAALGTLNEALGSGLPILAAPYAKPELAGHPAFAQSLELLRAAGVVLTPTDAIKPAHGTERVQWQPFLDLLNAIRRDIERP